VSQTPTFADGSELVKERAVFGHVSAGAGLRANNSRDDARRFLERKYACRHISDVGIAERPLPAPRTESWSLDRTGKLSVMIERRPNQDLGNSTHSFTREPLSAEDRIVPRTRTSSMNMARRWTGRLVLFLAVTGTIGCDRVTKHVAATTLAGSAGRSYLVGHGATRCTPRIEVAS
jgi:hypothetical protein